MPTYEVTSPDGKKYRATVPEGVSRDDVLRHFQQSEATPEPQQEPIQKGGPLGMVAGFGEPVLQMATGMIAKPVSDVAGLASLGMEGLRRAGVPFKERNPLQVQQDLQSAMTYQPRTEYGQAIAEYNPLALLGKGVNALGGFAESLVAPETSGPLRSALGSGVHEAVNQLPMFLGLKAPATAASTEAGLQSGARWAMGKALKPTVEEWKSGKADKAIDTMLESGVNVTRGGAEKLDARIELLNDKIKDVIASSPAIISKDAVASRLQDVANRFKKLALYADDVATIQKAWDEFMNHPLISSDAIPIQLAQEMKQATGRSLKGKYGELKGAEIEARKALTRGLKEEIASAAPEVRPLNAEESQLLNALSMTERRAFKELSNNPAGFAWFTTNLPKFAAYMGDKSSLFKSLVARTLSGTAKAVPEMTASGPVAGAAVAEQAEQSKLPQ